MQTLFSITSIGLRPALRRTVSAAFAIVTMFASHWAAASDQLTLPPHSVVVTPSVAGPNVERTVKVSGLWNDGCVPVGSSLERDGQRPRTLIFKLFVPQTFVACTQALTPYEQRQTYTPREEGVERILVVTNDGRWIAEGQIVTQGQGKAHSMRDLTGFWLDSRTVGSGLSLTHSFATSDILIGAWFYYDNQGKSRWGSIQKGSWQTPTVYVAELLEVEAAPGGCPQYACPQPATAYKFVASIRIEVQSNGSLIVEALGPQLAIFPPPPPNVLFRSEMTRFQP
jgi:hypothetical protein